MKQLLLLLSVFPLFIQAADKPNIIIMIGDGMGPSYMTAYRLYQDNPQTPRLEITAFDKILTGTVNTSLDDHVPFGLTDSGAAATAIATGEKTFFRAVGVNKQHKPLKTTLEIAREMGYQTGVIVTSRVNHATPAAFAGHVVSRDQYKTLADQYFDDRINGKPKLDIIFGGGLKYFKRDDRDLIEEFKNQGYQTVTSWSGFNDINQQPAIALMSNKDLSFEIDSTDKLKLTRMTRKALSLLDERPAYLVIEGSKIDSCGHNNDIACVMHEMYDFEQTLKLIQQFVDNNPNTLLVLTADHSTGGLSIAANRPFMYKGPTLRYMWRHDYINPINASVKAISRAMLIAQEDWYSAWLDLTDIKLGLEEKSVFEKLIIGYTIADDISLDQLTDDHRNQLRKIVQATNAIINGRTESGWTTGGHTGVDVNLYSYGKYADRFRGHMDNTDIGKIILDVLKASDSSMANPTP